jgi:hypothetical protein
LGTGRLSSAAASRRLGGKCSRYPGADRIARSARRDAAEPDAVERHAPVPQGDERVVSDDEMVEKVDVEETARGKRLGGQVEIVGGWGRIAGRVVVDKDHARRVEPDGVPEQLTDPDQRRRHVALVNGLFIPIVHVW